ncbi:MAG: NnrS family protein [Deltaproteobacteria bacterium]|nr:NnrS family protein [Deltaproteobacteria bacterium]
MTLFAYGFRAFFLLAATFTVLQMPLWILGLAQIAPTGGIAWHAHEMIFGFVTAVIAGFLLTAARNWTGRDTASGPSLAFLCALWLAGRIAVALAAVLPPALVGAVDLCFLPALGFFVARPILQAKQHRQLAILGVLFLLAVANGVFYFTDAKRTAWLVALDLVLALIVIIGGRVIPFFTRSAIAGAPLRSYRVIEALSVASMAFVLGCEIAGDTRALGAACLFAGLVQAMRLAGWASFRTTRAPILWVLHKGYAWLALGLVLRGLSLLGVPLPEPSAIHVLTTGAIGTLILGMMSRVALGHTGRPMIAPASVVVGFVLLAIATPVRAFLPVIAPASAMVWYAIAGGAWTLGFALYLARYAPWLVSPRADGKPG